MSEVPAVPKDIFSGKRWEGEQCKGCKHSSTYHPRGNFCCKSGCECDKFEYSGKQATETT